MKITNKLNHKRIMKKNDIEKFCNNFWKTFDRVITDAIILLGLLILLVNITKYMF